LSLAVLALDPALHWSDLFLGPKILDEEEVVAGEEGAVEGGVCLEEKAPGASFVMVALA